MDAERALGIAAEVDAVMAERLRFVYELDRLKNVLRQTILADGTRQENSAEHSWHLAMVALVMAPHAREPIDVARVLRMLLVHDIVEIDAGDAFIYDDAAREEKEAEERVAATRIFGLLPEPEAGELRGLWEEYEARETPEARFAYSCDRLQPLLLNLAIDGGSWKRHGVTADRVKAVNSRIAWGLPAVWDVAEAMIDAAVADGALRPVPD